MLTERQIPKFALESWYSNYNDHRCPHDAWLEEMQIKEPATGTRNENRKTLIVLRLLGAYHDGHIVFTYSGVRKYSLGSRSCDCGLGDWLKDEFSISKDNFLTHQITWAGFERDHGPSWTIDAEEISYEWIPKSQ